MRHFCDDSENCKTRDCVVCLREKVVCANSFTSSRNPSLRDGGCCEECAKMEAGYNWNYPDMPVDEKTNEIRYYFRYYTGWGRTDRHSLSESEKDWYNSKQLQRLNE